MPSALKVVDNLLGFVKDGAGKPSVKERALFAASVVFTYGIWENYVEQLAIELAETVATGISPDRVPEQVRRQLDKKSAWDLAVSPGWRALWVTSVREKAIGDEDEKFGLNTARVGQVKNLLSMAGVADAFRLVPSDVIPEHFKDGSFEDAVNELVTLRGEIVHTGKVPDTLRKSHVRAWRKFVESAINAVDESCRAQCKELGV
ncbi:MAG: hypothetical protein ABS36_11670 [Acidobacteria bacterium SCN 69-37]|nr:MAG: hypothetical protein ABS36_11670 [Acidobacteria bacterium SCN 69-37]